MADTTTTASANSAIRVLTGLGAGVGAQEVTTIADSAGNLLGTAAAPFPVLSPDAAITGSLAVLSDYVAVTTSGRGEVAFQLTGTWVGTVSFQGTVNSAGPGAATALWVPISANVSASASAPLSSTTTNGIYVVRAAGYVAVRVFMSAYTSGTATVWTNASSSSSVVALSEPVSIGSALPTGANTIGAITGTGTAGTPATGVQTVQGIAGGFPINTQPAALAVTTTAAISTAATLTLPAAGAGLFHYITGLHIKRYAGAALTGAAAPVVVTTTNLPGSLAFSFDTAGAIGTSEVQTFDYAGNPLKSSVANTATTVVAPLTTSVIWRITATYYAAA